MFWLLVFFLTPIAEMYLLIEVAGYIHTWPTIALVMLTAVIGVALLKRQGLATLTRGTKRMQSGQLPAVEMAEGMLLAVAGALLITPGFLTDSLGFMLLFPPFRVLVAERMLKGVQVQVSGSSNYTRASYRRTGQQTGPQRREDKRPVTLEGDFERK